ncbi:MAG: GHMP family kinase ATP-binding protein [Desulfobacteria bacterium]
MATNGLGTIRPFRVVVPNRVDIAGGTLDIYPLYLLIGDAITVNAAVAVRSEVEVRPFRRGAARLSSGNFGITLTAADTHGFSRGGKLGLLSRALRHFPAVSGVEIRVRNEAPVGSGIGASSALLVALMLAAARIAGGSHRTEETAGAAMEIEAAHLKSLTGRQDHLAALRGGIQGIRFLPGRIESHRLPPGGRAGTMLRDHGFLAHTGIAHHSSDVNWRMIRGAIDGDGKVLRKFRGIAAAARDAWEAVSSADPRGTGAAIAAEWTIRKTLAPGVSTAGVEELLPDRRFRRLVSGAKLCGAGGGGMLFGLLRDPDDREAVEALLSGTGMSILPFRISGGPRFEETGNGG